jgi:putative flippase GtrA
LLPKRSTFKAPFRYFLVVVGGFGLDFVLYSALVSWGESIYLANAIGFCIGAAFNVLMIRRFVFSGSRFGFGTDLGLTLLTNGTMLIVGMGILWILVEWMKVSPYLAKLLANGLTFVLNYATRATYFSVR